MRLNITDVYPLPAHPCLRCVLPPNSGEKSPLSAGTPRHDSNAASSALPSRGGSGGGEGEAVGIGAYAGPSPLRKRLRNVADTALAAGITVPMHTTFEVVRALGSGGGTGEGVTQIAEGVEGGMDFIVSVISGGALEAKVGGVDGKLRRQRC